MLGRFLFLLIVGLALAACDSGITGASGANQAPETELAVRVTDLRETLEDGTLTSTVEINWSGTDRDGFVESYDLRYFDESRLGTIGGEEGWISTTARDTTILLPIPPGSSMAAVVVEVRAVDNAGLKDATPARTIFPIRNSPPTFRIVDAEAPADTTWPVFSFAWVASDPDGEEDLAAIEVAFNDSLAGFTRLPSDIDFATFVAEDPGASGATGARVFLGRGFQSSEIVVPGLLPGGENVVYLRAADRTDTTSTTLRFPRDEESTFFVKRVTSDVLLVNDFRTIADVFVMPVARETLTRYGTTSFDEWDLSETPQTDNNPLYSAALPATPDPTLRQTLALWENIYWVSNRATNRIRGNNLPLAASVMDLFFDQGGTLFVHVPITLPITNDDGENTGNAALNILPLEDLVELPPENVNLRILPGEQMTSLEPIPGTSLSMPTLTVISVAAITSALPYEVGSNDVPLARIQFFNHIAGENWEGTDVIASISSDRRVGLFVLPVVNTASGALLFGPATSGGPDIYDALGVMLEGLNFSR